MVSDTNYWEKMGKETVSEYFVRNPTLLATDHKVIGRINGVYDFSSSTTFRLNGGLEVSVSHKSGEGTFSEKLHHAMQNGMEVTAGIRSEGSFVPPQVMYMEIGKKQVV